MAWAKIRPCTRGLGMTIMDDLMPRAQGCARVANVSRGHEKRLTGRAIDSYDELLVGLARCLTKA